MKLSPLFKRKAKKYWARDTGAREMLGARGELQGARVLQSTRELQGVRVLQSTHKLQIERVCRLRGGDAY